MTTRRKATTVSKTTKKSTARKTTVKKTTTPTVEPIKIVVDEHNKKMLQQLNAALDKAQTEMSMAQMNFNAILGQRNAIMNALINTSGNNGLVFDLTPENDMIENIAKTKEMKKKAEQNGVGKKE